MDVTEDYLKDVAADTKKVVWTCLHVTTRCFGTAYQLGGAQRLINKMSAGGSVGFAETADTYDTRKTIRVFCFRHGTWHEDVMYNTLCPITSQKMETCSRS